MQKNKFHCQNVAKFGPLHDGSRVFFFPPLNFCFVTTLVILCISQICLQVREESRFLKACYILATLKEALSSKYCDF
jgi:hypothetical protein